MYRGQDFPREMRALIAVVFLFLAVGSVVLRGAEGEFTNLKFPLAELILRISLGLSLPLPRELRATSNARQVLR